MSAEHRIIDIELQTPENSLNEYHFGPSKDSPQLAKRIEQRLKNPEEMTEDHFVLFVRDMIEYTGGHARKEESGVRFWSRFTTADHNKIELMSQKDEGVICTQYHYFGYEEAIIEDVYTSYDDPANPPGIERTFDLTTQSVPEFRSITGEMISSRQKAGIQPLDMRYFSVIATNIYNAYTESQTPTSQENN